MVSPGEAASTASWIVSKQLAMSGLTHRIAAPALPPPASASIAAEPRMAR